MKTSERLSSTTFVDELHPTLNETNLDTNKITVGSHKKLWWSCSKNKQHEAWLTSVRVRAQGGGCPTCAGKVVQEINSLVTTHPEIAEQFDNNNTIKVVNVSAGSNKTYLWLDKTCGHSWKQTAYSRTNQKSRCPVCEANITVYGVNSLFDKHPDLQKYWSDKNTLDFMKLSPGSHKEVIWVCDKKHSYLESVTVRVKRKTCPVCAGRSLQQGVNDLATVHPEVAASWSVHNTQQPDEVVFNYKDKAEWVEQQCGHTYTTPANMRVKHKGCLICKNIIVVEGINDLVSTHKELSETWSTNNDREPNKVSAGSAYRAEWKCAKGHNWEAYVYSRTRGSECPQCNASNYVSKGEEELFKIVTTLAEGKSVEQSNRSVLKGQELDILIPELKLAVEFNGLYWHNENSGKDKQYHQNKMLKANEADVTLIQIWEDDWSERKTVAIRMLASKMKTSATTLTEVLKNTGLGEPEIKEMVSKHGARECHIEETTYEEASKFLDTNHIQGPAKGTKYTMLKDKNGVARATMVSLKKSETWEIVRYATYGYIPGGFTKLMVAAERTYGIKKWVTFSDGVISEGNLYKNNGFIKDAIIPADYRYIVNGERVHKFNYRLKRFYNDPALKYVQGHTERQLADLNRIPRIWDAGKIRWLKIADKGGIDE